MMKLDLFVVLIVLYSDVILGCGITTHIEIAHRATKYFEDKTGNVNYKQLILDNQDAFQAGNPYPDAYYSNICAGGKYHDISEDTHWAPFLKTTIQYIRDKYPQPWDKDTRKLVVFLLGFASHQVADVSWHSLGIDQGFLTTMGDINFFGSFPNAHTVGDMGGDVLSQAELDLDYISTLSNWYIPVNDLYEVYKMYYNGSVRMEKSVIIECTSLLFLARLGEKIAFAELYTDYSSKSPFMVEEFESYFLGGVDDMATWTQRLWRDTILMLQSGTDKCDVPENPIYINCSQNVSSPGGETGQLPAWNTEMRGLKTKLDFRGLRLTDVNVTESGRGVYLSPSETVKVQLRSMREKASRLGLKRANITSTNHISATPKPKAMLHVSNQYARLGRSIGTGDMNGDHTDDLIIGAPGYGKDGLPLLGRVYVIYGSERIFDKGSLDLDQDADIILQGFHAGGKFGSAVSTLDINLDGYLDLAVSAPSVGSERRTYEGEVYVFLGSSSGKLHASPNITITCSLKYCNFGWSLSSGDFDLDGHLDLLVGSPFAPSLELQQAGRASVLLAGSNFKNVKNIRLTEKDMNFTILGEQEYGWFGHKVTLRSRPGLEPLLLISQPTYRICAQPNCSYSPADIQSVGALDIHSRASSFSTVLEGQDRFEKLGAAMSVGDPFGNGSLVVAVGADTKDVQGNLAGIPTKFSQAGKVQLYKVNSNSSTQHNFDDTRGGSSRRYGNISEPLQTLSTYEGDRRYGRFGGEVMFEDVTGDGIDDLIISSSFRTEDISELLFKVEEGSVYVYKGGPSFDVGDVTNQCHLLTTVKPCPADKAYAVLSNGQGGSRFGSTVAAWKFNGKSHLVVSAPRSSTNNRLAGEVYIYTLGT